MGKQKYPTTEGGITAEGETRQRSYHKSGKLAQRRQTRHLEAVDRQTENVNRLEAALVKSKNKAEAEKKLAHARLTLEKIRGGVPHSELDKKFKAETTK